MDLGERVASFRFMVRGPGRLLVSPHPDGISCTVTGDGDSASPEQVDPWRQAAQAAVALIGTRNQISTWEAIVGVAPRLRGPVRPARAPARRWPGAPATGIVRTSPGGSGHRIMADPALCWVKGIAPFASLRTTFGYFRRSDA